MKMKVLTKLVAVVAIIATLSGNIAVTSDNTAQAQYLWTCYASSPVATGMGVSYNLAAARRIALTECAYRTPYGMVCVVTECE